MHPTTIIDRYSRWPAALPMKDMTAATVAKTLLNGWIKQFGVPKTIISDRGSCFTSTLFNKLNTYRPLAHGRIERWHRTLKAVIKCHTEMNRVSAIPLVVLALRCTHRNDLNATPA